MGEVPVVERGDVVVFPDSPLEWVAIQTGMALGAILLLAPTGGRYHWRPRYDKAKTIHRPTPEGMKQVWPEVEG
jgi:hypothetical protein